MSTKFSLAFNQDRKYILNQGSQIANLLTTKEYNYYIPDRKYNIEKKQFEVKKQENQKSRFSINEIKYQKLIFKDTPVEICPTTPIAFQLQMLFPNVKMSKTGKIRAMSPVSAARQQRLRIFQDKQ